MEKSWSVERCNNYVATITYANQSTQIPSSYRYEYTLKGNVIVDEFENVNPDDYEVESDTLEDSESNSNAALLMKKMCL